jgi:hypothetical protein
MKVCWPILIALLFTSSAYSFDILSPRGEQSGANVSKVANNFTLQVDCTSANAGQTAEAKDVDGNLIATATCELLTAPFFSPSPPASWQEKVILNSTSGMPLNFGHIGPGGSIDFDLTISGVTQRISFNTSSNVSITEASPIWLNSVSGSAGLVSFTPRSGETVPESFVFRGICSSESDGASYVIKDAAEVTLASGVCGASAFAAETGFGLEATLSLIGYMDGPIPLTISINDGSPISISYTKGELNGGSCAEDNICTTEFAPVCSVDGLIFSNDCFASCEGVTASADNCTEEALANFPPPLDPLVPNPDLDPGLDPEDIVNAPSENGCVDFATEQSGVCSSSVAAVNPSEDFESGEVKGLKINALSLFVAGFAAPSFVAKCSDQPSALIYAGASALYIGSEMMNWNKYQKVGDQLTSDFEDADSQTINKQIASLDIAAQHVENTKDITGKKKKIVNLVSNAYLVAGGVALVEYFMAKKAIPLSANVRNAKLDQSQCGNRKNAKEEIAGINTVDDTLAITPQNDIAKIDGSKELQKDLSAEKTGRSIASDTAIDCSTSSKIMGNLDACSKFLNEKQEIIRSGQPDPKRLENGEIDWEAFKGSINSDYIKYIEGTEKAEDSYMLFDEWKLIQDGSIRSASIMKYEMAKETLASENNTIWKNTLSFTISAIAKVAIPNAHAFSGQGLEKVGLIGGIATGFWLAFQKAEDGKGLIENMNGLHRAILFGAHGAIAKFTAKGLGDAEDQLEERSKVYASLRDKLIAEKKGRMYVEGTVFGELCYQNASGEEECASGFYDPSNLPQIGDSESSPVFTPGELASGQIANKPISGLTENLSLGTDIASDRIIPQGSIAVNCQQGSISVIILDQDCSCLASNSCKSGIVPSVAFDGFNTPPQLAGAVLDVANAENALNTGNMAGVLSSADSLEGKMAKVSKIDSLLKESINKDLTGSGLPAINFNKEIQNATVKIQNAAKKTLNNANSREKSNFLAYANNGINSYPNATTRSVSIPKPHYIANQAFQKQASNYRVKANNNNQLAAFDFGDDSRAPASISPEKQRAAALENYVIEERDISENGASIWDIVSNRYINSAFPVFLKRKGK